MAKVKKAKSKVAKKAKRVFRKLSPADKKKPTSAQVSDEKCVKIAMARKEGAEFRQLDVKFRLRPSEGMNAYRCVARGEKIMRSKAWREEQATKANEAADAAKEAEAAKARRSEAARKAALASNAAQRAKREAVAKTEPKLDSADAYKGAEAAAQELAHA